MPDAPTKAHPQHGFTLVELMVAMVIGLVLVAGVITLFIGSRRSFEEDSSVARMQDEARFAMREISRDLSMTSYLAEPLVPAAILPDTTLVVGTDCGAAGVPNWIYQVVDPATGTIDTIETLDNANGATVAASFSCIDPTEVAPGNDVVAIKRVAGNPLDDDELQAGEVYLRSNGTVGFLYVEPPDMVVAGPWSNWNYRPRIYYIRSYADTPGDGVPTLCRKTLVGGAPPDVATECIARGVERMQIEYGLDNNGDGNANQYLSDPAPESVGAIVSARVYLLVRTLGPDLRYTDTRTYTLSNAADYTPNDNFHRRLYSMTLTVHNLRNLRRIGL